MSVSYVQKQSVEMLFGVFQIWQNCWSWKTQNMFLVSEIKSSLYLQADGYKPFTIAV